MAIVLNQVDGADGGQGTVRERYYDMTFDAAYATAGVPLTARTAGMVIIFGVDFIGRSTVAGTAVTTHMVPIYDPKLGTIQLFGTAAGATGLTEIANATALTTVQFRVKVTGV